MNQGHVEISTKVFLMIFIVATILTGFVVWWAISAMQEITRSMGWG